MLGFFFLICCFHVPAAGYYNTETHPGGYAGIAALCAQYGASFTLTCVEMCDSQHPPEALCGPEGLLRAVSAPRGAVGAWGSGGALGGGAALEGCIVCCNVGFNKGEPPAAAGA